MKRDKLYVAVTGGIGSGKSAVLSAIARLGYPVFSADAFAHTVYEDPTVFSAAQKLFPSCFAGGRVDRKKLASVVFADAAARRALEEITHPAIMRALFAAMEEAAGDAVFAEVPLLFEGGHEKDFDAVIVVMRGLQERVRAAAARDGCTEAEVQARVAGQFEYEKNLPCGHTVLYNDGDLAALEEKTGRAVHDILQKAGRESRGG